MFTEKAEMISLFIRYHRNYCDNRVLFRKRDVYYLSYKQSQNDIGLRTSVVNIQAT